MAPAQDQAQEALCRMDCLRSPGGGITKCNKWAWFDRNMLEKKRGGYIDWGFLSRFLMVPSAGNVGTFFVVKYMGWKFSAFKAFFQNQSILVVELVALLNIISCII